MPVTVRQINERTSDLLVNNLYSDYVLTLQAIDNHEHVGNGNIKQIANIEI